MVIRYQKRGSGLVFIDGLSGGIFCLSLLGMHS